MLKGRLEGLVFNRIFSPLNLTGHKRYFTLFFESHNNSGNRKGM